MLRAICAARALRRKRNSVKAGGSSSFRARRGMPFTRCSRRSSLARSRIPLRAMASTKRKEQPLHSLVAGAFAGAVEGFATYPTEYVKTQAQFAVASGKRPPGLLDIVRETLARSGVRGLYAGCS